ncbi:uncharacterized protein KIAA2013 homolog isoform X1 [Tubulanus polymorphus]|uniref:uncharacterized protein KIAA2013 homolog isoform X1 n=1 Tax=Tubulanus polymorphus TaxID=672921 RepID=UPI003DA565E4
MFVHIVRLSVKLCKLIVCLPVRILYVILEELINMKPVISNIINTVNRNRRYVIAGFLMLLVLLYFAPHIFNFRKAPLRTSSVDQCLDDKLDLFKKSAAKFDVIINREPTPSTGYQYQPYIGNGKFGSPIAGNELSKLYIRHQRSLSLPVEFIPILSPSVLGYEGKGAYVTDFYNGVVHRIQCLKKRSLCVTISNQAFAHRARPSILSQEIRIFNPTNDGLTVNLGVTGVRNWKDTSNKQINVQSRTGEALSYTITTGTISTAAAAATASDLVIVVSVVSQNIPPSIIIKPGKSEKYITISAIHYSDPVQKNQLNTIRDQIEQTALSDLKEALALEPTALQKEHTTVWNQLWSSGLSISLSKAPGALNGDRINSTIYYVLSHSTNPLHEKQVSTARKFNIEKQLYFPDRCYAGPHTLLVESKTLVQESSSLWSRTNTADNIMKLVETWIITLEKQGCTNMVQTGADGILQAMLLSFGAFKFSTDNSRREAQPDHLEFGMHPRELHRDYEFRRLNYGNHTHVNITVEVGEDNKAMIYVAMDRNDKPYYACDAGCLDTPVLLKSQRTQFPVKLTRPLTAILYITTDKEHMELLKRAIHVREIVEAPAHEHHVIALHRHGHSYGGLPTLFWGAIAFLIIIFHLFLFKLIFNEFCQGQAVNPFPTRGKYNL